jgi:Family of unknown function (DUF5681)
MSAEIAAVKQRGRPFTPGQSGNPRGKLKGMRNRATLAAEALLDGEAEALTRKAVEMALAGDVTALKLCLERLVPPRKERPLSFALPPLASAEDTAKAIDGVLAALAQGLVTLGEAGEAIELIERCRRIIGPAPSASLLSQNIRIEFVTAEDAGSADVTAEGATSAGG